MTHEQLQAAQRAALSLGLNINSEQAAAIINAALCAHQTAVAVVDEGDDGQWAVILPDVSVRVGQRLYAAPAAPQRAEPIAPRILEIIKENSARGLSDAQALWEIRELLSSLGSDSVEG